MESENAPFMSSCPLYTGSNCMHYSLHGENKTNLKNLCLIFCHYSDLILGVITPLSAIFKLSHGDQF